MTYDEIRNAWNAQADEHNQWDDLGEDEKVEWAAKWGASQAQRVPLSAKQRQAIFDDLYPHGAPPETRAVFAAIVDAIDHHGITQEK